MHLSAVLESEIASKEFRNATDAEAWLGQHPLAGRYLFSHFLSREIITIRPDYTVGRPGPKAATGIAATEGRDRRKNKGKWGAEWPDRELCLQVLQEAGPKGLRQKAYEKALRKEGVDINHWIAFHTLKHFTTQGLATKDESGAFFPAGSTEPPAALFPGLLSMAEAEIACNAAEAARDPAFLKLPNAQAIHNYIDLHDTPADTLQSLSDAIRVAFGITVSPEVVLLERVFADSLRALGEADLRERPNG